jgi:hypothetical protein
MKGIDLQNHLVQGLDFDKHATLMEGVPIIQKESKDQNVILSHEVSYI